MTAEPFDFRVPASGQGERRASDWLTQACQTAPKKWKSSLAFRGELHVDRIGRQHPLDVLKSLPETALGVTLKLEGLGDGPAFLGLDRPLLLALLSGLLGEPATAVPDDRTLTPVEQSLLEFLLHKLLAPLQEAWPGSETVRLVVQAIGSPRSTCSLPPDETAIYVNLSIKGAFGARSVVLLLPQTGPFTAAAAARATPGAFERSQLESVLRELPARLSVSLGSTRLTLRQLVSLKPGDIVVLDQRIAEPLRAQVEGKDKFEVWPGALGSNQAVRIHAAAGLGRHEAPSPLRKGA